MLINITAIFSSVYTHRNILYYDVYFLKINKLLTSFIYKVKNSFYRLPASSACCRILKCTLSSGMEKGTIAIVLNILEFFFSFFIILVLIFTSTLASPCPPGKVTSYSIFRKHSFALFKCHFLAHLLPKPAPVALCRDSLDTRLSCQRIAIRAN